MRGCDVIVISPNGNKTEYESKRDFWRHSNYSLDSIKEAVEAVNRSKMVQESG